ncbi:DUF4157 domain-containing protein [Algoriphagus halophilus]|uniref:eCIS core domain-containing protein n=1 Tax=Algoriphagus halophilus TaxID=226505 RepID=UPI00358F9124
MHRHADQTPKNPKATGRKATHSVKHAVSSQQSGVESAFPWVDNRSEAVAQRKLKKMANSSLQVQASVPLHRMEGNHLSPKSPPIQKKENRTGLPDSLKSGIENLSGFTMDDVRVHYNSSKPAQLQAHAYAQGKDIHIASGQEKHLPHEAWHVVQQKQGRVKPTMQMKEKVNINDDAGLEKEADEMGLKAFQNQSIVPNSSLQNTSFPKTTTQRYLIPENEVDGSFTSQVSREKEGGGKTFLNQFGTGAQLESKTSSKVRVAVTGKMAIEDSDKGARQAKFFYADSDILNEANQAMAKINSPISFEEGTQVITVQDQEGNDHQLSLIIPVKHAGTENQETGTNVKIPKIVMMRHVLLLK